ncbi:hypothetical protein ACFQJD_12350 [Haloplanus sp. GCM10025708]|uniref:hypothetical protein n=1 Tax=Haloplanus sp. GCM10025708 TaxID=3252679 RepID=UPI0036104277
MRAIPAVRFPMSRRAVSGGAITTVGILLLGIPLYDIWDDIVDLDWSLLVTVFENTTFLLLAGASRWAASGSC